MSRSRWLPVVVLAALGMVPVVEGQPGGTRIQRGHTPIDGAVGMTERLGLRSHSTPLQVRMGTYRTEMRMNARDFRADLAASGGESRYPTLAELRQRLKAGGSEVPVNLVNGSDEIQAATWNGADPPVSGTAGWNYDEKNGEIWPNCRVTPRSAPADRSLAIEEYRRKGVPQTDGPWSGHTVQEAVRAIKKVGKLPRLDSPRSGKLFNRLVSPRNLDSCRDRKRPIENRLQDGAGHMRAAGDLLEAYGHAFGRAEVGDLEPIAIYGQTMRVAAMLAELGDEVLADTSGNAVAVTKRRRGVEQMHDGLAMMIAGGLEMLDQLESSPVDRRRRFVQEMSQSVPAIIARLPERKRGRVIEEIRSFEVAELRTELADLVTAVDGAVASHQRMAEVPMR